MREEPTAQWQGRLAGRGHSAKNRQIHQTAWLAPLSPLQPQVPYHLGRPCAYPLPLGWSALTFWLCGCLAFIYHSTNHPCWMYLSTRVLRLKSRSVYTQLRFQWLPTAYGTRHKLLSIHGSQAPAHRHSPSCSISMSWF